MKMEPTVSSETSEIRTQTPGNYPKRNKLHTVSLSAVSRAFKLYEFKYIYIYIYAHIMDVLFGRVYEEMKKGGKNETRKKQKTEKEAK